MADKSNSPHKSPVPIHRIHWKSYESKTKRRTCCKFAAIQNRPNQKGWTSTMQAKCSMVDAGVWMAAADSSSTVPGKKFRHFKGTNLFLWIKL